MDLLKIASRVALYPSSPPGTEPLSDEIEQDVWNAGYEAASWAYTGKYPQGLSGVDLFLAALHDLKDKRIPRDMNESHPQFWEYVGTFIDGAKSFANSTVGGEFRIT